MNTTIFTSALAALMTLSAFGGSHSVYAEDRLASETVEEGPRAETLATHYEQGLVHMAKWRFEDARLSFETLRAQDINGDYDERVEARLSEIAAFERRSALEAERLDAAIARREERRRRRPIFVLQGMAIGALVGSGVGTVRGIKYESQCAPETIQLNNNWTWTRDNCPSQSFYVRQKAFESAVIGLPLGAVGGLLRTQLVGSNSLSIEPTLHTSDKGPSMAFRLRGTF